MCQKRALSKIYSDRLELLVLFQSYLFQVSRQQPTPLLQLAHHVRVGVV